MNAQKGEKRPQQEGAKDAVDRRTVQKQGNCRSIHGYVHYGWVDGHEYMTSLSNVISLLLLSAGPSESAPACIYNIPRSPGDLRGRRRPGVENRQPPHARVPSSR